MMKKILCLLMDEINLFCRNTGAKYYVFGQSAYHLYYENSIENNELTIAMTLNDYLKIEKELFKNPLKDRCFESMETNAQFPFLYARYVHLKTLCWNAQESLNMKHPGIGIKIFLLIPVMPQNVLQKCMFYCKEGLFISKNKNGYLFSKKQRLVSVFLRPLNAVCGIKISRLIFLLGSKLNECSDNYYLVDCRRKRAFLSNSILEKVEEKIIDGHVFYFPKDMETYLNRLQSLGYMAEREFLDLGICDSKNNYLLSNTISCDDYAKRIHQEIECSKYNDFEQKIQMTQRKQKINRKMIRKGRWMFLRTKSYYELEDFYKDREKVILKAWDDHKIQILENELDFYIRIIDEHKEANLPMGYNKKLYDLVMKYLAYTENFELCEYMLKKRKEAFDYMDKMNDRREKI